MFLRKDYGKLVKSLHSSIMIEEVRRRLTTQEDDFDFCLVRHIKHSDIRQKNYFQRTEEQHFDILKEFILDDIKNNGYIKTKSRVSERTGDSLISAEIYVAFKEVEVYEKSTDS